MRKCWAWLAGCIGLAGLLVGTPFLAGFGVKYAYQNRLHLLLKNPYVHLQSVDYQRHFDGSDVNLELSVDYPIIGFLNNWVQADKPFSSLVFTVKQHIDHPSWFHHFPLNTLIQTEVFVGSESAHALQAKKSDQPLLKIHEIFNVFGHIQRQMDSDGLTFTLGDSASFYRMKHLDVHFDRRPHWLNSGLNIQVSDQLISFLGLSFVIPELEAHFIGKKWHHTWLGESDFIFPNISFQDANGKTLSALGLEIHSETDETPQGMNFKKNLRLDKFQVDDTEWGPLDFGMSLNGIHEASLKQVYRLFEDFTRGDWQDHPDFRDEGLKDLFQLLQAGTALRLDNFRVSTDTGDVALNAAIDWKLGSHLDYSSIQTLLASSHAEIKVEMGMDLVLPTIQMLADLILSMEELLSPNHLDLEKDQAAAMAREKSALLMGVMVQDKNLTQKDADTLFDMQNQKEALSLYLEKLASLMKEGSINANTRKILEDQYRENLRALLSHEERERQLVDTLDKIRKSFVANGYIIQEKHQYLMDLNYDAGQFTANGKPMQFEWPVDLSP